MKVIGIRRVDIDRDGSSVHGYKYYCTEEDSQVVGVTTDSFFASDRLLSNLPRDITLDDDVLPVYKRESRQLRSVVFLSD